MPVVALCHLSCWEEVDHTVPLDRKAVLHNLAHLRFHTVKAEVYYIHQSLHCLLEEVDHIHFDGNLKKVKLACQSIYVYTVKINFNILRTSSSSSATSKSSSVSTSTTTSHVRWIINELRMRQSHKIILL